MAVQVACSPKLEREADELDRHGDGDAAAKRREDLRLATIASDVGAFKATNPQATVAAFWRWYHPVDDPTVNVDPQVEALWDVVLADGRRDDDEDALMRQIAPLLGVNDRDSNMARRRVEDRRA